MVERLLIPPLTEGELHTPAIVGMDCLAQQQPHALKDHGLDQHHFVIVRTL